jgi:hypothetical protein
LKDIIDQVFIDALKEDFEGVEKHKKGGLNCVLEN